MAAFLARLKSDFYLNLTLGLLLLTGGLSNLILPPLDLEFEDFEPEKA